MYIRHTAELGEGIASLRLLFDRSGKEYKKDVLSFHLP